MGTNYYIKLKKDKICQSCNQKIIGEKETIHLGKSSSGWRFSIQSNGFNYYKDFNQFKKWLVGKTIIDEYDRKISLKNFIEMIEKKQVEKDGVVEDKSDSRYIIDNYVFCGRDFC